VLIEIEGRWVNPEHITHIGPIDGLASRDRPADEAVNSYLVMTSGKVIYVRMTVEALMATIHDGSVCDG
jgi:hypothetical protein